jgi:hypothetical protein
MTKINAFTTVLILSALVGCGKKSDNAASTQTGKPYLVSKKSGTITSYLIDLIRSDVAHVYIPSADRFATIDLQTGRYAYHSGMGMYYSSGNCTGTPVMISDSSKGVSGKTVYYDVVQSKYYLIGSRSTDSLPLITYASVQGSTCNTSLSGSVAPSGYYASVTEVAQPYNFEADAPITFEAP